MSQVKEFPGPATAPGIPLFQSGSPLPVPTAPKSAIQIHEEQLVSLIKQREQAIGTLHSIEGALQYAQHMIGVLKREAAKAQESSAVQTLEEQVEQAVGQAIKTEIETK